MFKEEEAFPGGVVPPPDEKNEKTNIRDVFWAVLLGGFWKVFVSVVEGFLEVM